MTEEAYNVFREFKKACRNNPGMVIPIYDSAKDARTIYSLKTIPDLLRFISNGGLERLEFESRKKWKKNFTKEKPLYAYAYFFHTNAIPGYISIVKSEKDGKWFIKSFHPPKDKNPTLASKLKELGIYKSEEE